MKTRWMTVMALVLTFAAGVGVGLLLPWPPAHHDRRSGGQSFGGGLELTEQQREQMREIWTQETGAASRESDQKRREAFTARREAVQAMLTPEQQEAYAAIQKQFDEAMRSSHEARRAAFDRANERTREMLSDEQRKQYDAWLEKRREQFERGRERGPGAGEDGERSHRRGGWRDGGGERGPERSGERGDRPFHPEGMDTPPPAREQPAPGSDNQDAANGLTS